MNEQLNPPPAPPEMPSGDEPTPVSGWKKKSQSGLVVELPSGNHARVRTPGLPTFLKMGFIPDNLTNIIRKAVEGDDADEAKIISEMLSDSEKLNDVFELYDRVVEFVFVEPPVQPPPDDDGDRSDDIVYTDEIDFEDKAYVFNFVVGGNADLHRFRDGQTDALDRVRDGEAVGSSTE